VNRLWFNVLVTVLCALLIAGGGPCTNLHCCVESNHHGLASDHEQTACCPSPGHEPCIGDADSAAAQHGSCCCHALHLPPALQSYAYVDVLAPLYSCTLAVWLMPGFGQAASACCPLPAPATAGSTLRSVRSTVLLI